MEGKLIVLTNRPTIQKPEIIIVSSKDDATVYLYGRIDVDSSPDIRGELLTLFEAPHPATVSIDLSAVTQIDSSGVATLIEALNIARAHGTKLRLEGLHDRLRRLFEFTSRIRVPSLLLITSNILRLIC